MTGTRLNKPLLIALMVAALVVGLWAGLQLRPAAQVKLASELTAITLLPEERPLPDLQLVNQDGNAVGRDSFTGHWSLVFMGFTSCSYVCPTTMATLRTLQEKLDTPVQVVFVSVDPGRDTPEVVKQYVQKFDAGFVGLTGEPAQIEALAKALGAAYSVNTDPENYVVDHSSAVFLISPDAGYAGVMTPPLEVAALATDLNRVL